MPIKAENKGKYPKDWKQIREAILERAGHCCEECGVKNHEYGYRDSQGGWHPVTSADLMSPSEQLQLVPVGKLMRIVLTIAHLDHDPTNNDPANLRAWCQRCHNRYDVAHRANTRRATLSRRTSDATKILPGLESAYQGNPE